MCWYLYVVGEGGGDLWCYVDDVFVGMVLFMVGVGVGVFCWYDDWVEGDWSVYGEFVDIGVEGGDGVV